MIFAISSIDEAAFKFIKYLPHTTKAGTPLIVKDPAFALQLPLRVLVTQTPAGVQAVFTDTHALIDGSRIEYSEVENTLANAEKLIRAVVAQ